MDFFSKGGGAEVFSVMGGEVVPPNSAEENSAKEQVFLVRNANFKPFFGPFYSAIFWRFKGAGGGGYPLSGKNPLSIILRVPLGDDEL